MTQHTIIRKMRKYSYAEGVKSSSIFIKPRDSQLKSKCVSFHTYSMKIDVIHQSLVTCPMPSTVLGAGDNVKELSKKPKALLRDAYISLNRTGGGARQGNSRWWCALQSTRAGRGGVHRTQAGSFSTKGCEQWGLPRGRVSRQTGHRWEDTDAGARVGCSGNGKEARTAGEREQQGTASAEARW